MFINLFNDLASNKEAAVGEHAPRMRHGCESGATQIIQRDLKTNGTTLQPTIICQSKSNDFASLTEAISAFRKEANLFG